jgi:hypothetical protein
MAAGLGSDTSNHLARVAHELNVNLERIDPKAREELIRSAERCCEARRLNEGVGVAEADNALKGLLRLHRP